MIKYLFVTRKMRNKFQFCEIRLIWKQLNRLSIWSQEADEVGVETGHVTHVVEAVADLGTRKILTV